MNITRTQNASKQTQAAVTISMPRIDSEKVADSTWNVLDTVETFAGRSGYALVHGVGGAIPFVGYNLSKHIRNDFQRQPSYTNSVNQVSNAATGVFQVAGMAVGGAAAIAGMAGYSGAGTLGWAAGGLFGLAGVSAMLTTYSTEHLENLTGNFGG